MPKTAQQGNAARQLIRTSTSASEFRSQTAEGSREKFGRMTYNKHEALRNVKIGRMFKA